MRIAYSIMLSLLLVSAAWGQEKIDNPEYKCWSALKIGTIIVKKTKFEASYDNSESVAEYKLLEIKSSKAIVEVKVTTTRAGKSTISPPTKIDIDKSVSGPTKAEKEKSEAIKKDPTFKEGEEAIKISDKDYKAKWWTITKTKDGIETEEKNWICDDVPLLNIKQIRKTTSKDAKKNSLLTAEVTEIKVP